MFREKNDKKDKVKDCYSKMSNLLEENSEVKALDSELLPFFTFQNFKYLIES